MMVGIDWRQLYAQNRAAIAAAGLGPPARVAQLDGLDAEVASPPAELPAALLAEPRRQRPATDSALRRGSHVTGRVLVHVPPDLDPSVPVAAVCMLHGCTQDPSTFAAATAMNDIADRHGFVVVYPAQPRARNAQACWNWFLPAHQQRGAGEPELVAGIVRGLIAQEFGQRIDPARTFVAGLSSGGALALIVAACYPDLFAAVAIHSGMPYRCADDMASAFAAMGAAGATRAPDGRAIHAAMGEHARPVPSLVIHGSADRTVAPANAGRVLAQMMHANHLAAPETCEHDPARPSVSRRAHADGGLWYTHNLWLDADGAPIHESIQVEGLGHAWSGGAPGASYTDPRGPSASEAIWAFFARQTARPLG
jgi:poly(hydroxyalkanoate) depolymerase family esterase